MDFQYDEAVALLHRTPATLTALLRGLPEAWTRSAEGPETWSAYDIVGHLLNGDESDWVVRARFILEHGEVRPFVSVNRTAMFEKSRGKSLDDLLAAFARVRAENLATLDAGDHAGEAGAAGHASGAGHRDAKPTAGDVGRP